jgi:flagellar basal body-associated protein FliL
MTNSDENQDEGDAVPSGKKADIIWIVMSLVLVIVTMPLLMLMAYAYANADCIPVEYGWSKKRKNIDFTPSENGTEESDDELDLGYS